MTRPSWDSYFLSLARTVSTRATCPRLSVGAVLVRDRVVLASGYNGSMRGADHCDDVGHLMVDGHCVRTNHAEANAIAQAAAHGTSIDGATAYVTHRPCWGCLKLLVNAGVHRVLFGLDYGPPYPDMANWNPIDLEYGSWGGMFGKTCVLVAKVTPGDAP